jgi:hypothetical protein
MSARHEYFFALSYGETCVGGRKAAARGGLFFAAAEFKRRQQKMLKSEKIAAGPIMSFTGATRRMFRAGPVWLRLSVTPVVWLIWVLTMCPVYYLGGWMFFRHGVQRRRLVEEQRHRELLAKSDT